MTLTVWAYRLLDTNGRRRLFRSLLHGSMANAMPSALGMQKCQPGRQVICMCGDGGLSTLFGDLMTTVQEMSASQWFSHCVRACCSFVIRCFGFIL